MRTRRHRVWAASVLALSVISVPLGKVPQAQALVLLPSFQMSPTAGLLGTTFSGDIVWGPLNPGVVGCDAEATYRVADPNGSVISQGAIAAHAPSPEFTLTVAAPEPLGTYLVTGNCNEGFGEFEGSFDVVGPSGPMLSLTPGSQSRLIGQAATVGATLVDGSTGVAVAGAFLSFAVAGTNRDATGDCVPVNCSTDANGQVTWTYTGANVGEDVITSSLSPPPAVGLQATATATWSRLAPQKHYVALGDSYSSGEGAGAGNYFQWYETLYTCTRRVGRTTQTRTGLSKPVVGAGWTCTPYTVGHDVGCHRAPTAWSFLLSSKSSQIGDNENAACSGATISKNLLSKSKENEQPQVDRLRQLNAGHAVDLVTFTIGGDDVGFREIAKKCFMRSCRAADREVQAKLDKLDLVQPIRMLHNAAPGAVIAYVSYPQVVPKDQADAINCGWLTPEDREAVRGVVGNINLAEHYAVTKARQEGIDAIFIDITNALAGHELCSADSHMVRIYGNNFNNEQAHPDVNGQQDLANAVYDRLVQLAVVSG